eukprot:9439937-Alexandrium_andersonii.AAC.1
MCIRDRKKAGEASSSACTIEEGPGRTMARAPHAPRIGQRPAHKRKRTTALQAMGSRFEQFRA